MQCVSAEQLCTCRGSLRLMANLRMAASAGQYLLACTVAGPWSNKMATSQAHG